MDLDPLAADVAQDDQVLSRLSVQAARHHLEDATLGILKEGDLALGRVQRRQDPLDHRGIGPVGDELVALLGCLDDLEGVTVDPDAAIGLVGMPEAAVVALHVEPVLRSGCEGEPKLSSDVGSSLPARKRVE